MTQEIIPDRQTVQSCLSKKTYFVDFYQREYIWSKNTVEILLRDIFYAFEISYEDHKNEEMTEEVLEQYNWYYMNVFITNKVNSKVFIVDGQQRLTTLLSPDLISWLKMPSVHCVSANLESQPTPF